MQVDRELAVRRLGQVLKERELTIAVAESETAGLLAAALSGMEEASRRFLGGVVAYTYASKQRLLGVSPDTLSSAGAVSEEVAGEMAAGARERFDSDVSLSVTGVAGPAPLEGKPVGLTYIAFAMDGRTSVRRFSWNGGRTANMAASVEAALQVALEELAR
jgi:nicotinamide-nucleotide amidase